MIIIMAPTKTFNENVNTSQFNIEDMDFKDEIKELSNILKGYSISEIMKLMKVSEELGKATYKKYEDFEKDANGYEAIYYFYGEAFKGLDATTLDKEAIDFANDHLLILSGLYGILRPLNLMKPYRLEMGTKLSTSKGKDLYEYWKTKLTPYIMKALEQTSGEKVLINLASDEYRKALNLKEIKKEYRVVTIGFKENRDGQYKTVGTYAKKARGIMARYILENKIETVEKIKEFSEGGYKFNVKQSDDENLVFTR